MDTIRAKVSSRLLTKASRLFTGTLDGRIIEILQNARRAGATEVGIASKDGFVTVRDNGAGIGDFSALLDLGSSAWDESVEKAEDPAGVGIFCLAPRDVTVCSNGKKVVISRDGWTGRPVELTKAGNCTGAVLTFADEPWERCKVERHAVFSGLNVTVDGKKCPQARFCSEKAVHCPDLGCRIEVCERRGLHRWHKEWIENYYCEDTLVNFHGQVIRFRCKPLSEDLHYLVDMTGEPTAIRLMLPARTRLIENEALEMLKAAVEEQAYRFIQKRGSHRLPFAEYQRAGRLGVELPEAEPVYAAGLLTGDPVEPVQVTKPDDFPLAGCYRLGEDCKGDPDAVDANVHLLAALGRFEEPFVVVDISSSYDGYSWAKLPTVDRVRVRTGKELGRQWVWCEMLVAVDSLQIIAHVSDGRTFKSDVPMAIKQQPRPQRRRGWTSINVYVTPKAREELYPTDIWYHLGGWSDEGDTYDTQMEQFEQDMEMFWSTIMGPGEYLRTRLLSCISEFRLDWRKITIDADRAVTILYKDGSEQVFEPSASDPAAG